jgi:BirA family transcriptional regulator, biotin operon repressor / biotin---[acetyl-CoA-carboxylase] ligase
MSYKRPLPAGIVLETLGTVTSTNDIVRERASEGALGPLWVRATSQTKGRGRRGRSWLGAPGNLFMTGLLTLDVSPSQAANLSFVAALAVAEAIEAVVPSSLVGLKWPNDVLLDGQKCCGILLESWESTFGLQVVVGIGINVKSQPDNIDQAITCLADHALPNSNACDAATLFEFVLSSFHYWLALWREQGFEVIRDAWLARAMGVGQPIVARLPNETLEGVFVGLAPDGALLLQRADGLMRQISAGDVFFPA